MLLFLGFVMYPHEPTESPTKPPVKVNTITKNYSKKITENTLLSFCNLNDPVLCGGSFVAIFLSIVNDQMTNLTKETRECRQFLLLPYFY